MDIKIGADGKVNAKLLKREVDLCDNMTAFAERAGQVQGFTKFANAVKESIQRLRAAMGGNPPSDEPPTVVL